MAERFDFETVNFTGHAPSRQNVIRVAGVIAALLLLFCLSPFGTIAAGERGVHLGFTAVTGKVFGEGLYFRVPLIESVQMMDVKVQKYEMKSDAASKDLQTVHSVKGQA
jgi:regulator of protease activity HflC (stomatin/prohibitin superfamily)